MKKILTVVIFIIFTPLICYAYWEAKIYDDIFDEEVTKAYLIGFVNVMGSETIDKAYLLFNCDKDNLSLSVLYEDKNLNIDKYQDMKFLLATKVDNLTRNDMLASPYRHDAKYVGYISYDRKQIVKTLRQLVFARSKISFGISDVNLKNTYSSSGNVINSTKATNEFLRACKISI